jgi:hypothetical protein
MKGEQRGKRGGDQWLIKPQTGGEERGRDVQQRPCGGRSGERGAVPLARAEERAPGRDQDPPTVGTGGTAAPGTRQGREAILTCGPHGHSDGF